jgi:ferredoxin
MQQRQNLKTLRSILANDLYPGILQWPTLAVFLLILFNLFAGPRSAVTNLGSVFTWSLWWPALAVLFLFAGRIWCSVCPFSLINDLIQKMVGSHRPVPALFRRYGFWIMSALIIVLTWVEVVYGITDSPLSTGILLLSILAGVMVAGAFLERRSWCRYLCPLGGIASIYSRAGMIELRASPSKCGKCNDVVCYKGTEKTPGCPLFECPKVLASNSTCNLCGACVKNCPNDSVSISVRAPFRELWSVARPGIPEACLAAAMAGVIVSLNCVEALKERISLTFLGIDSFKVSFTLIYLLSIVGFVLLVLIAAKIASVVSGTPTRQSFSRFGYAFIPVVLFSHIASTQGDFLEKGRLIFYDFLASFRISDFYGPPALVGEKTMLGAQFTLLGLGLMFSLYCVHRIARGHYAREVEFKVCLSFALLFILYAAANIGLLYVGYTYYDPL